MKAKTSPTSPKFEVERQRSMANVWRNEPLVQPPTVPWGRIFLLTALFSLVASSILVGGWVWYARQYPHSWAARFLPSGITTTVVTPIKEKPSAATPKAVSETANTVFAIAADRGTGGVYTQSDLVSLALPLSSNGWFLAQALPNPPAHLVALPLLGNSMGITTTVTDPATSFIFFKGDEISQSPVSFSFSQTLTPGMSVWVLGWLGRQATITPAQLAGGETSRWLSSDRQSQFWRLSVSATFLPGSPVVDANGQLLGLVGAENKVWPTAVIEPVLKQIVQNGSIERPMLGVSYLNQALAVISAAPTARGMLIGAEPGTAAVNAKSPADKVNLRSNDVITKVGDQTTLDDLFTSLLQYQPGDKVVMTFQRQGVQKTVTVQLTTL